MTSTVACLALFVTAGFLFLWAALLVGRLLRAQVPTPQKLEPYECGEPPVGSSFVQYDLRFYVIALVFIIFEVEVALFFPPATIFGKASRLMRPGEASEAEAADFCDQLDIKGSEESWGEQEMYPSAASLGGNARAIALASMADLGVFFAVILLGFAYVWRRGDLDWVRAAGPPRLKVQDAQPGISG